MGVPELSKPRGAWCIHCARGSGCRIYAERPAGCQSFLCGWLTNPRFGPEWKPDRSKIVITVGRDGNSLDFQCDPGFPEAWRKEPYYGEIKRLSAIAGQHDGTISIQSGRSFIIVSPDSEFPLGEVRDEDEIIREFAGTRLIGVRVVKAGGTPT
jgi:hypothetical protein